MKTLKQEVFFDFPARVIYELLTDSKKHAAFTDSSCDLDAKPGGKFRCYNDYIKGEFTSLILHRKIVQKWRGSDFPKGHYSFLTLTLEDLEGGKSKLTLVQRNVPENVYDSISQGWKEHYWDKMKAYLKKGKLVKFV